MCDARACGGHHRVHMERQPRPIKRMVCSFVRVFVCSCSANAHALNTHTRARPHTRIVNTGHAICVGRQQPRQPRDRRQATQPSFSAALCRSTSLLRCDFVFFVVMFLCVLLFFCIFGVFEFLCFFVVLCVFCDLCCSVCFFMLFCSCVLSVLADDLSLCLYRRLYVFCVNCVLTCLTSTLCSCMAGGNTDNRARRTSRGYSAHTHSDGVDNFHGGKLVCARKHLLGKVRFFFFAFDVCWW